jgi:hypothetical protein
MAEKYAVLIKYKYLEYIENAGLSEADAWRLMRGIIEYDKSGALPVFENPVSTALFAIIKADIDSNKEKWEKTIEARRNAGKKGMDNRWGESGGEGLLPEPTAAPDNKNNSEYQNITKITNDNKTDFVKENITKITVYDSDHDSVNESGSTHTDSTPDQIAEPPPEEKRCVCFDSQNIDSQNLDSTERPQTPPGSGEKTGPPHGNAEQSAEYDREAALHPGRASPDRSAYETICSTWNTPVKGVKLPACRVLAPNLTSREREILQRALRDYQAAEIVNGIKNYLWVNLNPGKVRICLKYGGLFAFLEKALPTFVEDSVFDNTYLKDKGEK